MGDVTGDPIVAALTLIIYMELRALLARQGVADRRSDHRDAPQVRHGRTDDGPSS